MLLYLNQLNFNPYGKISKSVLPAGETLHISCQPLTELVYYNVDISINILSGLCALCIATEQGLKTFLLDKPVRLHAGTPFGLTAIRRECQVSTHIPVDAEKHSRSLDAPFSPMTLSSDIEIKRIITLFYQEKEFGLREVSESHDFYELTYVDKGNISNIVEGMEYITRQGELLFFTPNQPHAQSSCGNMPSSFFTITFDMDIADSSMLRNKVFHADMHIKNLFGKLLFEYDNPEIYSNDLILCYLKEIILRTLRNNSLGRTIYKLDNALKSNVENGLVQKIIAYIETHIDTKITLSELSEVLRLNSSYISRLFKKHTGMNISGYITLQKLSNAKHLLKSGNYTVTEVSQMLGFSSIHYFSNRFKDCFGIPPMEYSKMVHD